MDSSISYDPELRVREVGARIVISSRAYELRQASTASFSDSSAFSQDSQASALLDGDKSSASGYLQWGKRLVLLYLSERRLLSSSCSFCLESESSGI